MVLVQQGLTMAAKTHLKSSDDITCIPEEVIVRQRHRYVANRENPSNCNFSTKLQLTVLATKNLQTETNHITTTHTLRHK